MAFTDESLAHLKKLLEPESSHIYGIPTQQLIDLVTRLEAAERVCFGIENICDKHDLHGQAEIDIKVWRDAAGK